MTVSALPVTLWLTLVLEWSAAVIFAVLAAEFLQRRVRDETVRLANVLFALWWLGLATSNFVSGLRIILVSVDMPLTVIVGLSFVSSSVVSVGLAGLLYYLIFLFTGRSFLLWPLLGLYALFGGWVIVSYARWQPLGVEIGAWSTSFIHAHPYTDAYRLSVLSVLVAPQLVAVLALTILAVRLPQSAARVRMLVVAVSVTAYLGNALAASAYPQDSAWLLVSEIIPVTAGVAVLIAYRPPSWLPWRLPPEMPATLQREATRS
jgi:hypothetical protein